MARRMLALISVLLGWLMAMVVAQSSSAATTTTTRSGTGTSSGSSSPSSSVPSPPTQMTFPQCGTTVMVSGIAGSGCGFTDAPCLCKAKTFVNAASSGLAKACPNPADAQLYLNFINAQCSGQPNYPILLKQSSFGSLRMRPEIWSALGAAVLAAIGL